MPIIRAVQQEEWAMKIVRMIQRAALYFVGGYRLVEKETIGQLDQWTCNVRVLNEESIVVSGGVGQNISFEHALIEHAGCRIFLFDPSPTGDLTMSKAENRSDKLLFTPFGLAGRDGVFSFGDPADATEGSFQRGDGASANQFRCRSISSLAAEHGWPKIDLLKIDIEGFEYEVLDNVLSAGLVVDQICVEFHTSMMIDIEETSLDIVKMVMRLRTHGYRLVCIRRADFTFFHQRVLKS